MDIASSTSVLRNCKGGEREAGGAIADLAPAAGQLGAKGKLVGGEGPTDRPTKER